MSARTHTNRAFTLIEMIAVIVILGIVASVASPILLAVSNTYTQSMEHRTAAESVSIALDRIVRVIRETPEVSGAEGTPDVTAAQATRFAIGDGTTIELTGTNLILTLPATAPAVLCSDVSTFELNYIGEDAQPLNFSGGDALTDTYKIDIRIRSGDIELRASAFLREHLAS